MRSLTKPTPPYDYQAAVQVAALRNYRDSAPGRAIPPITPGTVLVATWNVANLGVHKRRQKDLGIIAEMISWYELIALQEIADNLDHLKAVVDRLPNHYDLVFSDKAGNAERSAYVYDTWRVTLGPKIGEIVIVESARDEITLPGISRRFGGFNRNPFIVTFQIESIWFWSTPTCTTGRATPLLSGGQRWRRGSSKHTRWRDGATYGAAARTGSLKTFWRWGISTFL